MILTEHKLSQNHSFKIEIIDIFNLKPLVDLARFRGKLEQTLILDTVADGMNVLLPFRPPNAEDDGLRIRKGR